MTVLTLFGALVGSLGPVAAATDSSIDDTRAKLDKSVPQLLADNAIPSVSIALLEQGRLALAVAYGTQSPGITATDKTLYNIASLTKPLTAEIVLRLASDGALSLDEPMYHYWIDPDIAADPRTLKLTPRLTLSHQSGFPNWRDRKLGLRFKNDPGIKYGYSGEGYVYLAKFVEKKTGRPFEELAQSYLLDKLGMKDTAYTGRPWFDGRIAIPADETGSPLKPTIAQHYNAADLVYTTPTDYAIFLGAVWRGDGLNPTMVSERQRIHVSMMEDCQGLPTEICPTELGFGLGWEVAKFSKNTLFLHTGHDDGIYTVAYLDITTGSGAVIFMNGQNGSKIAPRLVELLDTCPACTRFLEAQI